MFTEAVMAASQTTLLEVSWMKIDDDPESKRYLKENRMEPAGRTQKLRPYVVSVFVSACCLCCFMFQ